MACRVAERDRTAHWADLLATILLSVAAVATAWATYQAAHWRSEQGLAGNRSTVARVQANRASGIANREIQIDALTFTHWVDAYTHGDKKLAAFYFRRFRPEFRPAVNAWAATKPLTNPGAPLTPFSMPQYTSAQNAKADALEAKGAAESVIAQAEVSAPTATRSASCCSPPPCSSPASAPACAPPARASSCSAWAGCCSPPPCSG